MTRIAHISDPHFGRIREKGIVRALIDDVHAQKPDVVAISGDLTQRAYSWQYRAARRFVDAFEAPVVVVPGNHDVWPMWYPGRRFARPVSKFQYAITHELEPMVKLPEAWILGLNSAHGRTVKGGRVPPAYSTVMRRKFEGAPATRILVIHHPLVPMPNAEKADICRGGERLLEAAADCGVSIVLSGHLHVVQNIRTDPGTLLIHAGTATSTRGRGLDRYANTYNMIEVDDPHLIIERRDWDGYTFGRVKRETTSVAPRFQKRPGIGVGRREGGW